MIYVIIIGQYKYFILYVQLLPLMFITNDPKEKILIVTNQNSMNYIKTATVILQDSLIAQ